MRWENKNKPVNGLYSLSDKCAKNCIKRQFQFNLSLKTQSRVFLEHCVFRYIRYSNIIISAEYKVSKSWMDISTCWMVNVRVYLAVQTQWFFYSLTPRLSRSTAGLMRIYAMKAARSCQKYMQKTHDKRSRTADALYTTFCPSYVVLHI